MKINKVIILPHVFQDMDPKFTAKCDPALGFCTIGYDTPFMFECCFNLPLPLPPASASLMTLLLQKKRNGALPVFLSPKASKQSLFICLFSARSETS